MRSLEGSHPVIEYPCSWPYRIVCSDEATVRAAIVRIVGASEHTLAKVGDSSSGRYQRLELVVTVRDEAQRNEIFSALTSVPSVRFVL